MTARRPFSLLCPDQIGYVEVLDCGCVNPVSSANNPADGGIASSPPLRVDVPCQSGLYAAARNENTNYVPAHTLVNGRLTWRNPGSELDVSLQVTNLMDKY